MVENPRSALENNSGKSGEHDPGLRLTINDIGDRARTATQPEPSAQPLNRELATTHLSEINERHNVDPMRATEIAREPYRVPDSQSGRNQALQGHRESTSTTGFVGPKTFTDAGGNQMKGFESYDKGSGLRTFYGEGKDGAYKPYLVQGKTLQPLDHNGKPAGEPVLLHGHLDRSEGSKPARTVANDLHGHDSPANHPGRHNTHGKEHDSLSQREALLAHQNDLNTKLQQKPSAEGDQDRAHNNKPADADLRSKELGKSLLMMADVAGKQLGHLLDFLVRREQALDRVPNADQSRLLIREALRTDSANCQDLTGLIHMQRFLNQRNDESGMQNQQMFALNSQLTDVMRELINRVKNHDVLTTGDRIHDAGRTLDVNSGLALVGKIFDAANAAQIQDQSSALRNFAGKDIQDAKQQQQVLQPDKQLENKTDAGKMKNENNDQSKGGSSSTTEDKKFAAGEEEGGKKNVTQDEQINAGQLATSLANKLKDLKEREEKEKEREKIQDKDKKDPERKTRSKYRIREGDTLAALSERFLNNRRLAAAIFHINRTVIPVTTYNGKSYAAPSVESIIWIPGDDDIDLFNDSGKAKEYQHIGFEGVKYASAKEELMARFGKRWYGSVDETSSQARQNSDQNTQSSCIEEAPEINKEAQADRADGSARRANIEKVMGMLSSADKTASGPADTERRMQRGTQDPSIRRANIEKVLGPFTPETKSTNERLHYCVRLGESLKSIALKHPLLQSVETWKLLAAINGLSTQTDARGCPLALLKRGMTLTLPTQAELAAFRLDGTLPANAESTGSAAES